MLFRFFKIFCLLKFVGFLFVSLSFAKIDFIKSFVDLDLLNQDLLSQGLLNQDLLNRDLSNRDLSNQKLQSLNSALDIEDVKKSKGDSIKEIDEKINKLKELKKGYEAKAIRHVNQAQILQFTQGELQTAKRHWKLAEDNRKIAVRIQKEIDELQVKKKKLQKKEKKIFTKRVISLLTELSIN